MNNEEKILHKLEEHDERFDAQDKAIDLLAKKMLEHDGRFDSHDKRFDNHERAIDVLAKKAMEHDTRFDQLEKKVDDSTAQILQNQDEMITILRDLQEEIPAISHAVARHDKDITKIKEVLKIA
ncbi:hypothetical protein A3A21_01705 [Candidatus Jorgensenbacteria bacterium RIFCSPLOWO2_01_FULL_45_25b]|uniref:Uncharacterized protein n=1 Tax=Candidatus Jorgensenbacteria bacterium RIFCSPLOWO2_01_FULL_45_25b TaxID=1798471 RepID=A0A1F6BT57_9BACT|nr:MAG: hypothetical protein A3A21_01705 [Candidatus Jorgensenbacteria bacterium RIFCSPLOWO2_01_FULL_45_25b]